MTQRALAILLALAVVTAACTGTETATAEGQRVLPTAEPAPVDEPAVSANPTPTAPLPTPTAAPTPEPVQLEDANSAASEDNAIADDTNDIAAEDVEAEDTGLDLAKARTLELGDETALVVVDGLTWDVSVEGIYAAGPEQFGGGDCFVMFGVAELVAHPTGGLAEFYQTPDFRVIDDQGEERAVAAVSCDRSAAEARGWAWVGDAQMGAGSIYSFHVHMAVPEGRVPVQLLAAGDGPRHIWSNLTFAEQVPEAPPTIVSEPDFNLIPMDGSPVELTTYSDRGDASWTIEVDGIHRTENTTTEGICYAVTGRIRLEVTSGTLVTNRAPSFGLITDGRDTGKQRLPCSDERLDALGYAELPWAWTAFEATVPFYAGIELESSVSSFDVVTVSASENEVFFEPNVIGGVGPAPRATDPFPDFNLSPLVGTDINVFDFDEDWLITPRGATVVDGRNLWNDALSGRCVIVYYLMTAARADDPESIPGSLVFRPHLLPVADGRVWSPAPVHDCDTAAVEAAGYTNEPDFEVGVPVPVYSATFVPTDAPIDAFISDPGDWGEIIVAAELSDEISPP